jgi:tetratricopeptide (TPR) repeat protein
MRNNLGNVLRDQGRYAEAAVLYRQAVDIFAEVLPPQHPRTAVFRSNLAFCLLHLKRYAEAESLLLLAYDDLKASVGEEHEFTTRERLVELYETLGRPADAARYRPPAGSAAS